MVAPPVVPFPLTSSCTATDADLDENLLSDSNGVARNRRCAPTSTPTTSTSHCSGPRKRAVSDIYDRDEDAPSGRSDARPRFNKSAVSAEAYRLRVEAEQRRRDELRDAFLRLIDTLPRGPTKLKTSKVSVLARGE